MKNIILSIELVPSSSWLNNIRSIVTQKQWIIIKNIVYSKAYNMCEICGEIGPKHPVECHEVWHYDDDNLIQRLENMIALCPNCHMVKHIGLAHILGKEEKAIAHLMKINSWNRNKTNKYIKQSFSQWSKRSKNKWKLDISHLNQKYGIDLESLMKNK